MLRHREDANFEEVWKTLEGLRVNVTEEWKQCCVNYLREHHRENLSSKDSTYEQVLQVLLDSDFKESVTNIGVPLEQRKMEVSRAAKEQRRKYRASQIVNTREEDEEEEERARRNHISSSSDDDDFEGVSGGFRAYSKRMLKIKLTDGRTDVHAIEYESVPSLKHTSVGQKLLVKNVRVLRGLMMLDSASAGVIGGNLYLDQEIANDRTCATSTNSLAIRAPESSASRTTADGRNGSAAIGGHGRVDRCDNDRSAALDRRSSSSNASRDTDGDDAGDSSEWSEDSDHEAFLNEITSMEAHHTQRRELATTTATSNVPASGKLRPRRAPATKTCNRCTFENPGTSASCEMCASPLP